MREYIIQFYDDYLNNSIYIVFIKNFAINICNIAFSFYETFSH
jgi:hypothetical protein